MSSLRSPGQFDGIEAVSEARPNQVRYFVLGLVLLAGTALLWPLLGHNLAGMPFMPHSFCYLGNTTLITTHMMSDLLIGISYVVISLTLVYLVRASDGAIPFHWMFLAFGTFIIACGATHFMEVVTLWQPLYWISAYVKVITAGASVATAVALPLAIPRILRNVHAVTSVGCAGAGAGAHQPEAERSERQVAGARSPAPALCSAGRCRYRRLGVGDQYRRAALVRRGGSHAWLRPGNLRR